MMDYKKGGKMNSAKGIYSSKGNPLSAPKKVMPGIGPSSNSDAMKANRLLMQAQAKEDSLRGKSGL